MSWNLLRLEYKDQVKQHPEAIEVTGKVHNVLNCVHSRMHPQKHWGSEEWTREVTRVEADSQTTNLLLFLETLNRKGIRNI
jgi:hypothetical protein